MTSRTCPICEKAPPADGYRPFCSRRCADVDLQRWFTGGYAIAAVEANQPGDEAFEGQGGVSDPDLAD